MTGAESDPNRERRDRAERLYHEARSLPPSERAGFLASACEDDDALRAELTDLLQHGAAAENFFSRLGDLVPAIPHLPSVVAGRYEIGGRIGAGGMGVVYRARDQVLQRDVALKFLPPSLAGEPGDDGTLLREARAAAALEHANVCTVHEVGATEDGRPFICMTLYEGTTLKDRIARGPLPVSEAITIGRQLAAGLAAAHERGIVHGDIKPGNVMILKDGVVKLLDFGLARLGESAPPEPGRGPGTIPYMSPEQLEGEGASKAGDLFGLGVVLYEMLTGVRPSSEPKPLRNRNPAVSPALDHLVSRLLHQQPDARPAAAEVAAGLASLRSPAPRTRSRLITLGIVLAVAAALAVWAWLRPGPESSNAVPGIASAASAKRVAVLPLHNVGQDAGDDYLVDGLTEELIGTLSQVSALRVVARTSAFVFKGAQRDIRDIGRQLEVDAILEGSVQRVGDRIRVRVQLINVADGLNLWSETYDREITDVFTLQRDLARGIAVSMQAGLGGFDGGDARRRAVSPEAYTLYLKGRHFWNQRTSSSFEAARDFYQRAIQVEPGYAAAYAGLAAVYSLQGLWGDLPGVVAGERMRVAATRAVELDDQLAESHSVLGVYFHVYGWDVEAAEREQLRAIALDPRYVTARYFYGNLLRSLGRLDEAMDQYRVAAELDPLDPLIGVAQGNSLVLAGRLEEARRYFQDALELDSLFWWPHAGLGSFYEAEGRLDESLRAYQRAGELGGPEEPVARLLARTGRQREARAILARTRQRAEETGIHSPEVAGILFALGEADAAMDWLEAAYRERNPRLRFLTGQPENTALEADPRYLDLLRRVGLPPVSSPGRPPGS